MKRRIFRLEWTDDDNLQWAKILRSYADAAYPPGGSPCSQASHAALSDLAARIEYAKGHLDIGIRQRPMFKAALNWYADSRPQELADVRERMLATVERH